jgi:hypothetical protein
MNGLKYIEGGIYHIKGKFDNIENFLEYLSRYFGEIPLDKREVLEKINETIELFSKGANEKINQQRALQLVTSNELKDVKEELKHLDIENPLVKLEDYHQKYCTHFSKVLEADIEFPKLYIVENFPAPYDKLKAEALAPDKADEEMYGIPLGIYFLKDFLAPYYSAYLLPHEIVHVIIGKPNPYLLGRGLEEGLADLFGSIYGGMYILGENVTTNLTIYNRLSHLSSYWDIYRDYLRQGAYIYHRFGFDGIRELILGGRDIIKKVERQLLKGIWDLDLPSGNWDKKLDCVLDYLLSTFIRNLVVSPLAKYLSAYISVGDTVSGILREHNIDRTQGRRAIYELQNKVFVLLINEKGTIDYYDDWISEHLRYKIPKRYI